jgi:hypothetical protein
MKHTFYKEIAYLEQVESPEHTDNQRILWDKRKVRTLRMHYKNVPLDFITYLKTIGSGGIKEGEFVLFDGLKIPLELGLYPSVDLSDIKFFGYDSDNDFYGFDINSVDF